MDRFGEWRSIEPEDDKEKQPAAADSKPETDTKRDQLRLYGILAAAVLSVTAAAIWLTTSGPATGTGNIAINAAAAFVPNRASPIVSQPSPRPELVGIVVDVQGAVLSLIHISEPTRHTRISFAGLGL